MEHIGMKAISIMESMAYEIDGAALSEMLTNYNKVTFTIMGIFIITDLIVFGAVKLFGLLNL